MDLGNQTRWSLRKNQNNTKNNKKFDNSPDCRDYIDF